MEWYQIINLNVVSFIGLCLRGKLYDFRKNYHRNNSWKSQKKSRSLIKLKAQTCRTPIYLKI